MADPMKYMDWAKAVRGLNSNPAPGGMPVGATALRQVLGSSPADVVPDVASEVARARAAMQGGAGLATEVSPRAPAGWMDVAREAPSRTPRQRRLLGETFEQALNRIGGFPQDRVPTSAKLDALFERGTPAYEKIGSVLKGPLEATTRGPNLRAMGDAPVQASQWMQNYLGNKAPQLSDEVASGMGKFLRAPVKAAAEAAPDYMAAMKSLGSSAARVAEPVAEAAAPVARGALGRAVSVAGSAAGLAGNAYLGYNLARAVNDLSMPFRGGRSRILDASQMAKNDMVNDYRAGNYGSAAGDFVRATAAPLWEYGKTLMGGGDAPGFLGGEEVPDRNQRLAIEARDDLRREALKNVPDRAAPAAASRGRGQGVPLDILEDYAKVYRFMAPKQQSITDKLRTRVANEIMMQMNEDMADPKRAKTARENAIKRYLQTVSPQYAPYYGGMNMGEDAE